MTYHKCIVEGSEDVANSEVFTSISDFLVKSSNLLNLFILSISLQIQNHGEILFCFKERNSASIKTTKFAKEQYHNQKNEYRYKTNNQHRESIELKRHTHHVYITTVPLRTLFF